MASPLPVAVDAGQVQWEIGAHVVRRITLTNFRSFREVRLEAERLPVVLTGPNGAGKTNLLEAISFLSPGRGLRRARLKDVTHRGAVSSWGVAAEVVAAPRGSVKIGTGLIGSRAGKDPGISANTSSENSPSERRIVKIDGVLTKGQTSLASILTVDWLTPSMDRLFTDSAAGRRRFLDRIVFGLDPEHVRRVSAYDRLLRERSRLVDESPGNIVWLNALEETLSEYGVAISAARREAVIKLGQSIDFVSGEFPPVRIQIVGQIESWLEDYPALEVEARMRASLFDARSRGVHSGIATVGPHRSDLSVWHGDHGTEAEMCSTGEQKALLITLVLAGVRMQAAIKGMMPVLLLDEVGAHLDQVRRKALYEEICGLGVQAWLTGTERASFSTLEGRAQFCEVGEGRISRPENRM